jgi:hypothetical protein
VLIFDSSEVAVEGVGDVFVAGAFVGGTVGISV